MGCRNKTNSLFGCLFSFLGQATRVQIPTLIQTHGIRAKSSFVASQDALAQSELGFSLALELSASPPRLLSPSSSPPVSSRRRALPPSPLALELSVPCLLSPSSSPSRLLSASSSHSPVACRPRALAPSTLVAGEDLNPSGCVKRYEGKTVDKGTPGESNDNKPNLGKRKRFMTDEDVVVFNGMKQAVSDVAAAVRESIHAEAAPGIYNAVINCPRFSREALMYALNHMMEHKATSLVFLDMTPDDRDLWLKTFLAKHYHN
uniref:Uncharacterized protein n=1 Tax=Zea mays TaxID=4577 RepID=A0A804QHW5_MAIZE